MIGLCDCNNFFVSCERVFRPDLRDKPVVVLSNNDGCIISRSNEAKALGLTMAMPLFKARSIVDRAGVSVFSSNYRLYGDMSERVMSVLKGAVPCTEVYSIDEAFLDFSGMDIVSLQDYGVALSSRVKRATGIPVSIGIAPTKTLAKIASKLCKQYPKLRGCCLMYRQQDIEKVLRNFEIGDVWGIGRRHRKMLNESGVVTAYDFRERSEKWVLTRMGITGLRTWKELRGEKCINFEHTKADRQSICVSRSFSKGLDDIDSLRSTISTFASLASRKLRNQGSLAEQMQVFIYTDRHRDDEPQSYENCFISLDQPTDSTFEITSQACLGLKKIYRKGFAYKKAGVVITKLCSRENRQMGLFENENLKKQERLMDVVDSINSVQGLSTIKLASQGNIDSFSNRKLLSPEYTTKWSDILTVRVGD